MPHGPPPRRWSTDTGLYAFGCGTATALVLSDVLRLLADVIDPPARYAMVVLATPALLIAPVVWWAPVERRGSRTYLRGVAVGVLTALGTALVRTARFVSVWRVEMTAVPMVGALVLLVIGLVAVAGLLTGVPLMYARRRLDGGPAAAVTRSS
jgi:hypothetical protein